MRKFLLLIMGVFLISFSSEAQERTVTGKVTSTEDGTPLPGVNVIVKGTTIGTATDSDGNYSLQVPQNAVLVFSFIGLSTEEVPLAGRTVIDVSLGLDLTQLSEVIITGSAPGITKKTIGYSVGEVGADLIQRAPGIDPAAALQGKVAGVKIVQNGAPGSNAGIRFRGSKSLYESQAPLVLIDGVIVDGGLATINSEDIENIEILKSSSAAALYGSRGANGAIIVKTRRGANMKEGSSRIVFRNEIGRNYLPSRIDLSGVHNYEIDPATGAPPFGNQVARQDQLHIVPYPRVTNYQDLLFQENPFKTSYLSVTGATKKANFMVSTQYADQPGVVINAPGQERLNFKVNMDYKISDALTLSTSNFYSNRTINNGLAGAFFDVLLLRPDLDLRERITDPNNPNNTIVNPKPDPTQQMVNPLYNLFNRTNESKDNRYIGSWGINYAPLNWLTFEGFIGLDQTFSEYSNLVPKGYVADDVAFTKINVGGLAEGNSKNTALTSRANIVLSKRFGDISLSSRIGYWYESNNFQRMDVDGNTFAATGIHTLNNLSNITSATSSKTRYESENMLIQIGAVYKDKLTLDLLGRRDAVSLFGPNARNYSNYRVAASYRLTEDVTIPGIQELKIRASHATSGVWPGYSAQYETFNIVNGQPFKNQLGNTDLQSATAVETEVGINVNFLNKFTADITYVMNDTRDQIIQVPLPFVAGYANQWQNAGNLEYRGIEISIGATDIVNLPNFRWSANLVFDKFTQEITNLPIQKRYRNSAVRCILN
jgi:TonB-linked SusC/RagA family outer membrane protein